MAENKKRPAIRFTGFTEDWESRKVGDFAQRESNLYLSSATYPSVEYEDVIAEEGRLNKDIRLKETKKMGIVFDGRQVLYGKLRPYLHNWLNPDFQGVAVGDWWVLRPVEVDKSFLFRLLQTRIFDEVANQSSGSKMPRADWDLVSHTEFFIPTSQDEQRLIANTLDHLDRLITLHQRKYEKLTHVKKAMLEKMFPKHGSHVPEIRFKGFTEACEQRKLGEIAKTTIGEFVIKTMQKDNSPYPVYNGETSYTGFYDDFNNEGNKILVSARGANAGFVNIIKTRYWGGNSCYSIDLIEKDKYDTDFIYQEMKRNQAKFIDNQQAANIPSVSKSDVETFDIIIPAFEEQTRIAECFAYLDHLITLHQRKLIKLQTIKKSLLEKMFV